MTKAEMKRLERIHILRQLSHYEPITAKDLVVACNTECDGDAFDELPEISPRGITMKLQGLSVAGLATGKIQAAGGPIFWRTTERGRAEAFASTAKDEEDRSA